MDKPAQRYLKRLSRGLICAREDRERLLRDARAMLENFSQENPGAFYGDYTASFGPPEEFAAQMLLSLDPEDVSEARLRRKRTLMGTGAAAAVLVVLALGFWFGQRSRTPAKPPAPSAELTAPALTPGPVPTPEPTPEETVENGDREAEAAAYLEGFYKDSGAIHYKRAVAAMDWLGVMISEDEFRPEAPVDRALAAKYITLMMTGGKEISWRPEEYEPSSGFSDTQGYWAEAYIEYCVEMGILSGEGNGLFDPGAPVTGIEFAKMALAALGYEPTAYQLTGPNWDLSVNRLAFMVCDPSLNTGLEEVALCEPITREEAAQMMYNMLDNATIWAFPQSSTELGEKTNRYGYQNGKDGQPLTFFDVHFTEWERENIF